MGNGPEMERCIYENEIIPDRWSTLGIEKCEHIFSEKLVVSFTRRTHTFGNNG